MNWLVELKVRVFVAKIDSNLKVLHLDYGEHNKYLRDISFESSHYK
ncbi:MAG: hypothetical protein JXA77_17885 [Bacteroidales bacterium]|nr:hypothetical protein [Bacteroidales bacterium]MBN2820355.1 hypothetical protein [Bacteroidales bacterium]